MVCVTQSLACLHGTLPYEVLARFPGLSQGLLQSFCKPVGATLPHGLLAFLLLSLFLWCHMWQGSLCEFWCCEKQSEPETMVESRRYQRWVLYEQKGKWPAFCGHSLLLRGTIRKLEHGGCRVRKVVLVKILRFEKVLWRWLDLRRADMVDICTEGLPVLCFLGYHRLVQSYRVKHSLLFITFSYFHKRFAPNLASRSTFELSLYPLNGKGVGRGGWEVGDLNFTLGRWFLTYGLKSLWEVKWPFHRGGTSDICITIHNEHNYS